MRRYLIIFSFLVTLMLFLSTGAGAGKVAPPADGDTQALKRPLAVFPQTKYEFNSLYEGEDITHDFVVENKGDAPLVIKKVKPG